MYVGVAGGWVLATSREPRGNLTRRSEAPCPAETSAFPVPLVSTVTAKQRRNYAARWKAGTPPLSKCCWQDSVRASGAGPGVDDHVG